MQVIVVQTGAEQDSKPCLARTGKLGDRPLHAAGQFIIVPAVAVIVYFDSDVVVHRKLGVLHSHHSQGVEVSGHGQSDRRPLSDTQPSCGGRLEIHGGNAEPS